MKYNSKSKEPNEVLDFDTVAATSVDKRMKEDKSSLQDIKASSGKTLNQQLPEVCPLVFPELEKATGEQKENAFKRSLNFTRDYYDRRGQAEFASKNPDSKLNVQEQKFAGEQGDPTYTQNRGLLGVVSNGRIEGPRRRRWERKNELRQRMGKEPLPPGGRKKLIGKEGLIRRQIGTNTLYLMVVNMPTEEELQVAKEAEERMKREEPNWFEKMVASGSS